MSMMLRKGRRSWTLAPALAVGACLLARPVAAAETLATTAEQPVGWFFNAGTGLPEVLHVTVGKFFGPAFSLAGRANLTLFNPMLGVEALYTFGSDRGARPPRHGLLLGAAATFNPQELSLTGQGETIAASFSPSIGYGYLSDGRLYFRALLAALVYRQGQGTDAHFEMGPSLSVGLGLTF
jgi:hypothetical protein